MKSLFRFAQEHPWQVVAAYIIAVSWSTAAGVVGGQDSPTERKRIVIATREVAPFAMRNENGQWVGISIDLLRAIKPDIERESGGEVELEFREMGLDEMLKAVADGKVDLAAAALTVNYDREKRMDFTHPFHASGLGIAVSGRQLRGWDGVLSALFSLTFLKVVASLIAVLMAIGIGVYFFERKRNPHFSGGAAKGVASGIWWAAVTMTTVGYGDKVPQSPFGRLLGGVWMFAALFIIASFTAAVTSALTVNQLKSRIAGPADLSRVRVGTVTGSTSEKYLRSRHIISQKQPEVRAALTALQQGRVDAVVYDATILRYEALNKFPGEIHVLPVTFERQDYAFALPTNSPLREQVNQAVLREIGAPAWSALLADYLGEPLQ